MRQLLLTLRPANLKLTPYIFKVRNRLYLHLFFAPAYLSEQGTSRWPRYAGRREALEGGFAPFTPTGR